MYKLKLKISIVFIFFVVAIASGQPKKILTFGNNHILYPKIVQYLGQPINGQNSVFEVLDFNKILRRHEIYHGVNGDIVKNFSSVLDSMRFTSFDFKIENKEILGNIRKQESALTVFINENKDFYLIELIWDEDIVVKENNHVYLLQQNSKDYVIYIEKDDNVLYNLERKLREIFKELNHPPSPKLRINNIDFEGITNKQYFSIYEPIIIDGSTSVDLDGDPIDYEITLKYDSKFNPKILKETQNQLAFTPKEEGEYEVLLTTNDGLEETSTQYSFIVINYKNFQLPSLDLNYVSKINLIKQNKEKEFQVKILEEYDKKYTLSSTINYKVVSGENVWVDQKVSEKISTKDGYSIFQMQLRDSVKISEWDDEYQIQYWVLDSYNNNLSDTSIINLKKKKLGFFRIGLKQNGWYFARDRRRYIKKDFSTTDFLMDIDLTPRFTVNWNVTLFSTRVDLKRLVDYSYGFSLSYYWQSKEENSNDFVVGLSRTKRNKIIPFSSFGYLSQSTLGNTKIITNGVDVVDQIYEPSSLFILGSGFDYFLLDELNLNFKVSAFLNNKFNFKHAIGGSLGLLYTLRSKRSKLLTNSVLSQLIF